MNDGGPAFPTQDSKDTYGDGQRYVDASEGMSLRQYYAGEALKMMGAAYFSGQISINGLSDEAFRIADNMIIADSELRAKENSESGSDQA